MNRTPSDLRGAFRSVDDILQMMDSQVLTDSPQHSASIDGESPPNSQQTRAPRLTVRKRKASSNPPGNDQRHVVRSSDTQEKADPSCNRPPPTVVIIASTNLQLIIDSE